MDTLPTLESDQEMLKELLSVSAAAAVMATSVAVHALTLTNRDGKEHRLTIYEDANDDEWNVTVQPGETLSNLCPSGCSITIGIGEDQDFKGYETVTIVNNRLVVTK